MLIHLITVWLLRFVGPRFDVLLLLPRPMPVAEP